MGSPKPNQIFPPRIPHKGVGNYLPKQLKCCHCGQNNYAVEKYGGEALATVWAIAHFRSYLYGQHFNLMTDHQPLRWLMEFDKLTSKLDRWVCRSRNMNLKWYILLGLPT